MRLVLTLWFFCSFGLLLQAQNDQLLKFESEIIALGTVTKGELVKGSFDFTNVSDEDVTIELVSTCVCTDAVWPEETIAPGDSGQISFVFDSSKKDKVEPIDVDVILKNVNGEGIPYFYYLSYTFDFTAD